jgi:hypothetical protein
VRQKALPLASKENEQGNHRKEPDKRAEYAMLERCN